MQRALVLLAAFVLAWPGVAAAQTKALELTVTAGKHDLFWSPVCVPLSLPKELADINSVDIARADSLFPYGQFTAPSLTTESVPPSGPGLVRRDFHFIVTRLGAGKSATVRCVLDAKAKHQPDDAFAWRPGGKGHIDLRQEDAKGDFPRPLLRYVHAAYDDSTPERRNRTYKVFHHLYDPSRPILVTNGGYADEGVADPKKLLYPHHRGLMYGFNKITFGGGKKADTWHCQKDDHQSHEGLARDEGGPVLGRHRVMIDWHGPKKEVFAREERELTLYLSNGGTLCEFASRLKTTGGPVKLDGDPQHAGFQFRAHNDVAAKNAKQTYYLRPDGKGDLGKTRNWPGDKGHVNLPWHVMSFELNGKRYSAAYLNHPQNPGEQRYSERDYGRFGCYFVAEVTEDRPLLVNYRLWLQEGEMTAEQARALSAAFTAPPKVTVK